LGPDKVQQQVSVFVRVFFVDGFAFRLAIFRSGACGGCRPPAPLRSAPPTTIAPAHRNAFFFVGLESIFLNLVNIVAQKWQKYWQL
jgi:hypothetical protein